MRGELPAGWEAALPVFPPSAKGDATRNTGGKVLNALAAGASQPGRRQRRPGRQQQDHHRRRSRSCKPGDFGGPNIHFGVREHGMGGILNGMALHGGVIPYGATFLVFSDYMRRSMRLAALRAARHLRLHPRQHRPGRRRPDAPAHRATGRAARDPEHDGASARPTPTRPARPGGRHC